MNMGIQSLTESDLTGGTISLTNRFNEKLANIIINKEEKWDYYIEFMALCAFYKKVTCTNVQVIEKIIKLLDNNTNVEDVENVNFMQNLVWDLEDPELYKFMTCLLNL